MVRFKKETRGSIESLLDHALKEEEEILPEVEWVRQEIPLSSFRDFTVGYILGTLKVLAEIPPSLPSIVKLRSFSWTAHKERDQKIDALINKILRRRLPEIVEKIERELGR